MLEELLAALVHFRDGGVSFEDARAGYFLGEVFAGVKELEEAADSVDIFFVELYLSWLSILELLASPLSHEHRYCAGDSSCLLTLPSSVKLSHKPLRYGLRFNRAWWAVNIVSFSSLPTIKVTIGLVR